jgi:putative transposase
LSSAAGRSYAGQSNSARLRPPPEAKGAKAPRHWYLDEVVVSINGEKGYLWRAVDREGYVLDEIVQIHRNTKAARRLLTWLLPKQGRPPKRIITDKLGSYAAAKRTVMPRVEHCQHKG